MARQRGEGTPQPGETEMVRAAGRAVAVSNPAKAPDFIERALVEVRNRIHAVDALVLATICLSLTAPAAEAQGELGLAVTAASGVFLLGSGIRDIAAAPASARQATAMAPGNAAGARSPRTALRWSLGATLVPTAAGAIAMIQSGGNDNVPLLVTGIAVTTAAWVVGPATGHWYAGQRSRAARGVARRAIAAAVGAATAVLVVNSLGG
jgi:hypothetical protein